MADHDLRLAAWNLKASAGVTQTVVFTEADDNEITSLSVWVGGTVSDVDDTTDATEYTATISGASNEIATVSIPIPESATSTPLRLELDGVIRTVGRLQPQTSGARVPATTGLTLATSSSSLSLTVSGGLVSVGAIDGGVADSNYTGTTPIDGGVA